MNITFVTRSCLTAAVVASLASVTVDCFALESHSTNWITANADLSGKAPRLMQLAIPVAGGGRTSDGHAAKNIIPMRVASDVVEIDLCAAPDFQPSPCSGLPSVFVHLGNLEAWID